MSFLAILFTAVAALLMVPCAVLLVQVLAAMLPERPASFGHFKANALNTPIEVILLMPAHNEASGIAAVLQELLPQLDLHKRLLVVADNCTDDTAAIARAVGGPTGFVEVLERHDDSQRGKGYALDHGIRHLEKKAPTVVLIIDADCALQPGSIQTLAARCITTGRPVQALDLMQSPAGGSVKIRLAEFAWLVKNHVRALGYHRLGLPCQLMGTGMAFTWQQISQAKLNTGHIVEDMQLGIDLARNGTPPLFCPDALVTSLFPTAEAGLQAQRTRWEHGHLGIIVTQVPTLLWRSVVGANITLLAMALDLCVPPLALLTLLIVGALMASIGLAGFGGSVLPTLIAGSANAMLGVAVVLAWLGFGRNVISLRQLCSVPLYILAKVPLYFYFLVKRQTGWVRSRRDGEQ